MPKMSSWSVNAEKQEKIEREKNIVVDNLWFRTEYYWEAVKDRQQISPSILMRLFIRVRGRKKRECLAAVCEYEYFQIKKYYVRYADHETKGFVRPADAVKNIVGGITDATSKESRGFIRKGLEVLKEVIEEKSKN